MRLESLSNVDTEIYASTAQLKMTDHFSRPAYAGSNKRKLDSIEVHCVATKRTKQDMKKGRSSRERDRILLENFVKYGVLPPSENSGAKSITTPLQIPNSPVKTPKRHLSDDQRVPDINRTTTEAEKPVSKNSPSFWRPWLNSSVDTATACIKSAVTLHSSEKMQDCQRSSQVKTSIRTVSNHSYERTHRPNVSRISVSEASTASAKRPPYTPIVTTWDTRSPEFLKSFKQPFRLMWPKSQAHDYKYRDAQQLLHSFPVQATIGFYDDRDGPEDKFFPYQSHNWMTTQRCAPVLN